MFLAELNSQTKILDAACSQVGIHYHVLTAMTCLCCRIHAALVLYYHTFSSAFWGKGCSCQQQTAGLTTYVAVVVDTMTCWVLLQFAIR